MARHFRIKAEDMAGNCIMTSIIVTMSEVMALSIPDPKMNDGRRVSPDAVAEALAYIVKELGRYGLSECLLSIERN